MSAVEEKLSNQEAFWNSLISDYMESKEGLNEFEYSQFHNQLGRFELTFHRYDGKTYPHLRHDCWWLLFLSGRDEFVGIGLLHIAEESITTSLAALHSDVRGNNLYSGVLLMLCRLFGKPVYSDFSRTEGAEKAWFRAGADFIDDPGDEDHGLYRLVPGKLRPQHLVY